jgi:hypothetical protein
LGELESILVEREAELHDELVPPSALCFNADQTLSVGSSSHRVQAQAFEQIATKLRVPTSYLRRCPTDLTAQNLNYWLGELEGDVLVRFEGGHVRALLSERYQPISHLELVQGLLRTCPPETRVRWEISARFCYLQVLHSTESPLLGGISACNSETGHSTVGVCGLVYRVVCTNGLILAGGTTSVWRRHTRDARKTIEELTSMVSQAWPAAGGFVGRFESMRTIHVRAVEPVLNAVDARFALSDGQVRAVRTAFHVEPGNSLFDVINAYTRAGNAPELSLEERTQLQSVGGHVLSMAEQGHRWI